jgi:hypothetical protein
MKIQKQDYRTLEDMENDLLLMISNARKYNDPKSQIYKVEIHQSLSFVGRLCIEEDHHQCEK